jgi:hypothetical protein
MHIIMGCEDGDLKHDPTSDPQRLHTWHAHVYYHEGVKSQCSMT